MLEYQVDHPILIITVSGIYADKDAGSAQAEASRLVKENKLTGVLVDLREAKIQMSIYEIYEGTASHRDKFPIETKHAIVVPVNNQILKDVKFSENVAINRGIKEKSFTDFDEAIKWLRS